MATRLELRTLARIRADQDQSTFPTDTQVNLLLDQSGKDVWYDLMAGGLPMSFQTATIAANGSSSYVIAGGNLSAVFTRGVFYTNGSDVEELKRLNEGERASLMGTNTTGRAYRYNTLAKGEGGLVVELLPAPGGGSYTVHYIEQWNGFGNDAASWPYAYRSDELVVLRTAAKMLRKEGAVTDAKALEEEYSNMLPKVIAMASWTDMRNPATIRDVSGNGLASRLPFDYDISSDW